MPLSLFPDDIIVHYNLLDKVLNDFVYMEIHCGMYGLPQAGILANKLLKTCLACHGYFEVPHTPGLWQHISLLVWVNLCIDDFGVKYIGDDNLKHLFASLQTETYNLVEDWKGNLSPLIGIMHSGTWILTCPSMSGSNLSNTHTQHRQSHSTAPILQTLSHTGRTIRHQHRRTTAPYLMPPARNTSKKL
jgi:hypothetical protein